MVAPVSLPPSIDQLRQAVRPLCETRGVLRMEVFGSVALGTPHTGSDVDLLVEFLPSVHAGLFEMGELQESLEQRLGCPVDLLSRRAVEQSRNLIRRQAILANPITIYAR